MCNDPSLGSAIPLSNLISVGAGIEGIRVTLEIARALSGAGRQLDLSGLDHEIGALCAGVLDLDPTQVGQVKPLLTTLLNELCALEDAVRNV